MPTALVSHLPATARQLKKSYEQRNRQSIEAQLAALAEAPIDAERAVWACQAAYLVKIPGESPGAMSATEGLDRALTYVARARSSTDPSLQQILEALEPALIPFRKIPPRCRAI